MGSLAGTAPWTARLLAQAGVIELWDDLQWEMRGTGPESKGALLEKNVVAREARRLSDVARNRWPMMTDDATMTDRVAFFNCVNSSISQLTLCQAALLRTA